MQSVKIVAVEYFVPKNTLGNNELAEILSFKDAAAIYSKTGISNRHIADKDECASDLGLQAAKKLIEQNMLDPKEIELLIFCTQTPDYSLPSSACIMQEILGISTSCAAFDINLGCSGYVYGLAVANAFISSNQVKNALLITGDTPSKVVNPLDKSVRVLFGDAGTATYLNRQDGIAEIMGEFILGTDGSGFRHLIVPAGGFRTPRTPETAKEHTDEDGNVRSLDNVYMNGAEVFVFSLKEVPKAIKALLEKNNFSLDDIDWFIFHQANKFIIDTLVKKLKIPSEKALLSLEEFGNTTCSSIPITLKDAQNRNVFNNGDLIMLVGFGVGYSWGANLLRWGNET
jgi:3-oxoacyl-[acyl-carrier-protein] synthase III